MTDTPQSNKLNQHKKVVATLCYVENDANEILMLYRNKKKNDMHQGKYNGLGGKAEYGEDPYSCVIREVEEEAGIRIKPTYIANMTFHEFMPGIDWEVHLFRAKEYEGTLIDCVEGELEWVKKDSLLELNLWDGDQYFLQHLDTEKFFFAQFHYQNGKVINHSITFTGD